MGEAQQALNGEDNDFKETATDLGLLAGESVAWMGKNFAVAAPVASVFSYAGANREANRGITNMVDAYRDIVAADLNIDPLQVNEAALRKSAEHHDTLKEAVEAYDNSRTDRPIESFAGAGAAVASTAGIGALASAGALGLGAATGGASLLLTLPAGFAASWLGEKAAAGILNNEDAEQTAHGYVTATLKPKLESGQGLSSVDIFTAYVEMDDRLAQQLKTTTGDDWQDLEPKEQAAAMLQNHPKMAQICAQEAYLCNTGALTPEMVLFATPDQIQQTMTPALQVQHSVPAQVGTMPQHMRMQAANDAPLPQIATQGAEVTSMMEHQRQRG